MLTRDNIRPMGRYNWKNQPERLVYIGITHGGSTWFKFAKVEDVAKGCFTTWCEVRADELHMLEETKDA